MRGNTSKRMPVNVAAGESHAADDYSCLLPKQLRIPFFNL